MRAPTTAGKAARRITSRRPKGAWPARKAASVRAYREWMPVADDAWESYDIGDLATLFRPETGCTAGAAPARLRRGAAGPERSRTRRSPRSATAPGAIRPRTMLGPEQEAWLASGLRRSIGRGSARWQVLAQQVLMGSLAHAARVAGLARPESRASRSATSSSNGIAAARVGLPFNLDGWDGYPAARERLLQAALDADANLVVLSGDSHNAWAFDLDSTAMPPASSSRATASPRPAMKSDLSRVPPAEPRPRHARPQSGAQMDRHQPPRLCDAALTPERATAEWLRFLGTRSASVRRGSRRASGTA